MCSILLGAPLLACHIDHFAWQPPKGPELGWGALRAGCIWVSVRSLGFGRHGVLYLLSALADIHTKIFYYNINNRYARLAMAHGLAMSPCSRFLVFGFWFSFTILPPCGGHPFTGKDLGYVHATVLSAFIGTVRFRSIRLKIAQRTRQLLIITLG